jgi:hypothetical protein
LEKKSEMEAKVPKSRFIPCFEKHNTGQVFMVFIINLPRNYFGIMENNIRTKNNS